MTRRVISKLKIDELSAVDHPAQPGALARVMKRHDPGTAAEQFDVKVQEIQKRDGCPRHRAMSEARLEHPELYDALQTRAAEEPVQKRVPCAAEAMAAKARGDFMERARAIAKRDRVALHIGMSRARTEAPELFAAYG